MQPINAIIDRARAQRRRRVCNREYILPASRDREQRARERAWKFDVDSSSSRDIARPRPRRNGEERLDVVSARECVEALERGCRRIRKSRLSRTDSVCVLAVFSIPRPRARALISVYIHVRQLERKRFFAFVAENAGKQVARTPRLQTALVVEIRRVVLDRGARESIGRPVTAAHA